MKAIVIHAPGDLRYEQVADQPLGRDEVRVKIEVGESAVRTFTITATADSAR
jgi:hypothetical protein